MADLIITPANVARRNGGKSRDGDAGAIVTAGQVVYLDKADETFKLADSDGAAALRSPGGIALNGAAIGQPLKVHTEGPITIGAVLVPGTTYYLSPTPGGIAPLADLSAGDYPTIVGIAISTTVLDVKLHESGIALS